MKAPSASGGYRNFLTGNLLLLFLILWISMLLPTTTCLTPDRSRLNRFFELTNGHHLWKNNSHWNTTKPICSWFGVTCEGGDTESDSGVTRLELPSNSLVGHVAKVIYHMTSLKVLNLKDNSLIDGGLEGLDEQHASKLEQLDLSQNGLTSTQGIGNAPESLHELHLEENRIPSFPNELTKLHKLKSLYIMKNKMKGNLPTEIHKMTSLKHLNAYDNDLQGALPSELGQLSNLVMLSLAENSFSGTIPSTLDNLASLKTLSLHKQSQQGLVGSLPHFESLTSIREVYLDHNGLEGSIPHRFLLHANSTTSLVHIGLSFNQLSGTIPPELERFDRLIINAVGNRITHIPERLCKKKKWMAGMVEQYGCDAILCANGTYSTLGRQTTEEDSCLPCPLGTGSPYLGATTCSEEGDEPIVKILYEFYTELNGPKWTSRQGWEQFDQLHGDNLDWSSLVPCDFYGVDCIFNSVHGILLSNNGLQGTIPSRIFQLPDLANLDVSKNAVTMTHKAFKACGEQDLLTQLNIANTKTRNLDGIGLIKSVLILNIGGLKMDSSIPEELFALTDIHEIHARASKFTGTLSTLVGNLNDLTRLDLFNNKLQGSIPSEIGRLGNVRLMDLAENAFSGELPNEITSMTSLHKLHLHQTNGTLSGTIPAFDSSPKLVELLLDSNSFSGSIPSNFLAGVEDKTELIEVDLSHNAISGSIPSELEDFVKLDIHLSGNRISAIPPELCARGEWMNGDVELVGSCDAILCPAGTWNAYGRASDELDAVCSPCPTNTYFGSTSCGDEKDPFPEKKILDNLYKKTGGIHWTTKRNWTDKTVGICFREGITCGDPSDINSGVTEVHLVANNLGGHVPSSIFKLPNLRVLDFSSNEVDIELEHIGKSSTLTTLRMSNTDQSSISGIDKAPPSLTEVRLSNNRISGTIPAELLKLSSLKTLYMSNNYFNETIPSSITSLSSIEIMDFSQNDLTGHLPTELGSLTTLRVVNLSENLLSGVLVTELGRLSNLVTLSLALQNKLSGPLLAFNTNPSLSFLDLSHNSIQGTIPSNFLSAVSGSSPITVDLLQNEITGGLPTVLDSLQFLDINLVGNKIDSLPEILCDDNNAGWEGGLVGDLNTCDAILCPPGTAAPNGRGRQTDPFTECEACPGGVDEAPYFGSLGCTLTTVEEEREALMSMYQLTNGPTWLRQTNWMSEKSVCTWYGVTCVDDEIIISLELQHNNIEASPDVRDLVTDLIFSLQNLVKLDLRGNDVPLNFNRIPAESAIQTMKLSSTGLKTLDGISRARQLKTLIASDNYLSESVPDELFTLTQIESLYLSFNWLSGTLSTRIGMMTNLAQLFVDGNDLSGTIPSEIGLLSSVQNIVVSGNLFSGPIPSEIGSLPKLQLLSADRISKPGPRLSGTLPPFDNAPALTTLYLDHNDLIGSVPSKFLSASPLASFVFLGYNFLSGVVPLGLDSIPAIYLSLEENRISGFPNQFCNNSDWMSGALGRAGCDAFLCPPGKASPIGRANDTVTCESCSSSEAAEYYGSTSCEDLPSERQILLRLYQRCGGIEWYTRSGWATDNNICEWFGITCHSDGRVKSIDLTANNLVSQPPWEIFHLPRLESLVLSSNPIDFGFEGIGRAQRLTELSLEAVGLSSLKGLEEGVGLTSLSLRFNNLEGAFPTEILALTHLRELNLADNKFTSSLPSFSNMSRLRTLRLSSNAFTGPLPPFDDMVVLTTIDLSDNRLSGTISPDFLKLLPSTAKVHLNLASNELTGGVPEELARFEIMTIYLRDNRIESLGAFGDEFCGKNAWQNGDVDHFGCNAILCPPGTATAIGRQSTETRDSPCMRCEDRDMRYYGRTSCEPSLATKIHCSFVGIVAAIVLAVVSSAYLL